jgi:hypothetical protein
MMKIRTVALPICAAALLAAAGLAGCSNSTGNGNGETTTIENAHDGQAHQLVATLSPSDLEKVDITIGYGDAEAMEKLAQDMQKGSAADKVVEISGKCFHAEGTSVYSIAEPREDENSQIGVQFFIEDIDTSAYPLNDAKIKLKGKVSKTDDGLSWVVKTINSEVVQDA